MSRPRPSLLAEAQDHLQQYVREYYYEEEDQGSTPAEAASATARAFLMALCEVAGDDLAHTALLTAAEPTPHRPDLGATSPTNPGGGAGIPAQRTLP